MKIKLLSLFITLFTITSSFGQIFSVELSEQYGTGIFGYVGPQNEVIRYSVALGELVVFQREEGILTLGNGFQENLTLGAKLSDNLHFRIRGSYFNSVLTDAYSYKVVRAIGSLVANSDIKQETFLFSSMLMFQPTNDRKVKPYMAMGVIGGQITYTEKETITFTFSEDILISDREFTIPRAFGFTGQLGAAYHLGSHFAIRAGLDFRILQFYPTSSTVVSYTENEENKLSELTTYERETEYGDQFLYYSVDNRNRLTLEIDDDNSRKELSFPVTLSNVSLEIGVQYIF